MCVLIYVYMRMYKYTYIYVACVYIYVCVYMYITVSEVFPENKTISQHIYQTSLFFPNLQHHF